MGGGTNNDGVFANMAAKPEGRRVARVGRDGRALPVGGAERDENGVEYVPEDEDRLELPPVRSHSFSIEQSGCLLTSINSSDLSISIA